MDGAGAGWTTGGGACTGTWTCTGGWVITGNPPPVVGGGALLVSPGTSLNTGGFFEAAVAQLIRASGPRTRVHTATTEQSPAEARCR